jgi:hypothetical protein
MRELTHSLEYDRNKHRWLCKCGYILGDGHEKLYARCHLPKNQRPREAKRAYPQTEISSKPNKAALDLFNLAPPKPKRKKPR